MFGSADALDFYGGGRSGLQIASLSGTKKAHGSFVLWVGKRLSDCSMNVLSCSIITIKELYNISRVEVGNISIG